MTSNSFWRSNQITKTLTRISNKLEKAFWKNKPKMREQKLPRLTKRLQSLRMELQKLRLLKLRKLNQKLKKHLNQKDLRELLSRKIVVMKSQRLLMNLSVIRVLI
jgi:hypothetical protein